MSNETKKQVQEVEVKTDDELDEKALSSVAGGSFQSFLNSRLNSVNSTSTNTSITVK